MYIKITKNQRGDAYYHLVEAYRQDGKVKQRTLMSLGRVEDNKLEELAAAISKHLESVNIFNLAKEIDISESYILGPLLVLERMMELLGIKSVLQDILLQHARIRFDFEKVVFTQLCSRFIKPVSKLALFDNWLSRMYPGLVDHKTDLQHIYRSLDILAVHKEDIERYLYHWKKDLFTINVDVVLYDLTTLRFESTREDIGELRKFGYSKEMRTDCTQIVLGLLTDTDGIPLCFEVHPGNTFEGKTLKGIVEKMKGKFSIRRFIFIADRGLFSFENLEHIRADGGEFIVGLKMGSMNRKRQEDYFDLSKYNWINQDLAFYETTLDEDRCIVTWSRSRAQRDSNAREDILEKIRLKLAKEKKLTKRFITNRNYKKYLKTQGKDHCELDYKAIAEEAKKDGFFGIITNVTSMGSAEIVTHYKQLWKIEDSFGEIKGTLKARPMFHWTDNRIVGHLVLCFLAYLCEAHLTKLLRENHEFLVKKSIDKKIIRERELTVLQAMEELNRVMAIPVKVRNETIWVRTDIPPNAQKLIKTIGMRIPPKILQNTKM
ncbi:MAG: IS1634 family transposase [Bacteroidales bacterium]|nr:IS1634 family transposase [Bacteroidales bacterium]